MTNDEVRMVLELLQSKYDEMVAKSRENPFDRTGDEAHWCACGLSYAIGALSCYVRDE